MSDNADMPWPNTAGITDNDLKAIDQQLIHSLRDLFAASVVSGLVQPGMLVPPSFIAAPPIAKAAYAIAEAMIQERSKYHG